MLNERRIASPDFCFIVVLMKAFAPGLVLLLSGSILVLAPANLYSGSPQNEYPADELLKPDQAIIGQDGWTRLPPVGGDDPVPPLPIQTEIGDRETVAIRGFGPVVIQRINDGEYSFLPFPEDHGVLEFDAALGREGGSSVSLMVQESSSGAGVQIQFGKDGVKLRHGQYGDVYAESASLSTEIGSNQWVSFRVEFDARKQTVSVMWKHLGDTDYRVADGLEAVSVGTILNSMPNWDSIFLRFGNEATIARIVPNSAR